jgi:hypothetical protein
VQMRAVASTAAGTPAGCWHARVARGSPVAPERAGERADGARAHARARAHPDVHAHQAAEAMSGATRTVLTRARARGARGLQRTVRAAHRRRRYIAVDADGGQGGGLRARVSAWRWARVEDAAARSACSSRVWGRARASQGAATV